MYTRLAWQEAPFPTECAWGEDNIFGGRLKRRMTSLDGIEVGIVARVHDRGTSPRNTRDYEEIDYAGLAGIGYPVAVTA